LKSTEKNFSRTLKISDEKNLFFTGDVQKKYMIFSEKIISDLIYLVYALKEELYTCSKINEKIKLYSQRTENIIKKIKY
jgi:hypothetical protein